MAEIDVLRDVWRKALKEELRIPCKDRGEAIRLRMALYRAVKAVRSGKEQVDHGLQEAVKNCGISFEGEGGSTLVVANKLNSRFMQNVIAALGGLSDKSAEDRLIEESQARLLQKLAEPPAGTAPDQPAVRSTPYYTR